MRLDAYPPKPCADGTSLVVFAGPPNVAVSWSLTGPGTITPQSAFTDARGVAGAIFTPVTAGDHVTVTVSHGT